jgi:hypothetical protein
MFRMVLHSFAVIGTLATLIACGSHDSNGPASNGEPDSTEVPDASAPDSSPPEPTTDRAACVISADCPSGAYCDLGECIQECNTDHACSNGLMCSPRGRCVTTPLQDVDPTPSNTYEGTIAISSPVASLSETDTVFPVTLTSTSQSAVRYRIELEGEHLSINEPRGTFTGSTNLTVKVEGSKYATTDVPGRVRVVSTIGQASVPANLHAGISGLYRGYLSFSGGHIALGDARLRIGLSASSGGVLAWVDPSASLLFPEDKTNNIAAATGSGTFSGKVLTLTVAQRLSKAYGGDRNHLGRDIGRQVTMTLSPTAGGGWKGTFQETVTGLFVGPVTHTGDVQLLYESRQGFTPLVASGTFQAVTLSSSDLAHNLPGWSDSCTSILQSSGLCNLTWSNATVAAKAGCLGTTLYTSDVMPLYNAVSGQTPMAYSDIASGCAQELKATSLSAISVASARSCGVVPLVECGVQLAAQSDVTNATMGLALNNLVDGAVNPMLLVAQDRIMSALDSSIAGAATVTQERAAYDDAASVLSRSAAWIYQPAVLEGLRQVSGNIAAGNANATSPPYTTYPAARAIAKLLRTMRDLEAERTRLVAAENLDNAQVRRDSAQAGAISAYLESVALNVLLDTWGNVPDTVGSEVSGVINPFDSTFGAALAGTGVFGFPDSFVPFVYDPKDTAKGKNNFEQMLLIANAQVALYSGLETSYTNASKAAKSSDYDTKQQSLQLKTQYDARIKQLCGTDFNIDTAQVSRNVSSCGQTYGEAAANRLQLDRASTTLQGAYDQLAGMQKKIAIDMRLMKDKYALHDENLRFISDQGKELDLIAWSEGVINATQVALQTASQAELLNAFAPAALAAPMAMLEIEKTALTVAKQDLQTAQQMHFERQTQIAEELEAQANIEKQGIDLAQFNVQIQQSKIDHTSAQLALANALAEVQTLLGERADAIGVNAADPSHAPAFRIVRNDVAVKMLSGRARAQKYLYLAGRALEYELNQTIAEVAQAALVARSASRMDTLKTCLSTIPAGVASPQSYSRLVSVRKMLGITSERTDDCTGETLSEAQQFQRVLLANGNLDRQGGVTLRFATDLKPGNELWSTDVCNDRITALRAQLVGDFLGDDEAQINIALTGTAILRMCSGSDVAAWSLGGDSVEGLGTAIAVIQAGVNDFGKAAANASLFGQSVARAQWQLTIPGKDAAPTNSDVDLSHVDDIVLEITHEARPIGNTSALGADLSCLQQVL